MKRSGEDTVPGPGVIDAMFVGEPVVGVPTTEAEYQRKAPGAYDAQGDHCVS